MNIWRHGLLGATLALMAIAFADPAASADKVSQAFPDIVAADVRASGKSVFDFDVTVSSPYDTPQRYADAFRVMSHEGKVFGIRELAHDHAGEQPFTRDLYGVRVPAGIGVVVIEGRDRTNGWGGRRLEVVLPGR